MFAVAAAVAGVGLAGAAVDPGQRTVTVGAFRVQWSQTDPEEILSLSWNGSPNLTNSWTHPFCTQGGDHEFFGDTAGRRIPPPRVLFQTFEGNRLQIKRNLRIESSGRHGLLLQHLQEGVQGLAA